MRLRLLPSSFPGSSPVVSAPRVPAQPLTSFVVEGAGAGPLAVDAGSLGLVGEPTEMARIAGLVLTHAHIDHVASLPMWVEALLSLDRAPEGVRVLLAHLKPAYREEIIDELTRRVGGAVEFLEPGSWVELGS
ncbi:hypothetical protein N9Z54_09015 [Planctomycetota bacterium]|nr:hypothetical protein [Planctomycetota bacterium]